MDVIQAKEAELAQLGRDVRDLTDRLYHQAWQEPIPVGPGHYGDREPHVLPCPLCARLGRGGVAAYTSTPVPVPVEGLPDGTAAYRIEYHYTRYTKRYGVVCEACYRLHQESRSWWSSQDAC